MAGGRHEGQLRSRSKEEVEIQAMGENQQLLPQSDHKASSDSAMQGKQGGGKVALYCFLGIFVSYFIYGLLQEKM